MLAVVADRRRGHRRRPPRDPAARDRRGPGTSSPSTATRARTTRSSCWHRVPPATRPDRARQRAASRPSAGGVEAVARDLARQQAADGEGADDADHVPGTGRTDDAEARAVARAVVASRLVKAASTAATRTGAGSPARSATRAWPSRGPGGGRAPARRGAASAAAHPARRSRATPDRDRRPASSSTARGRPGRLRQGGRARAMDAPEVLIRLDLGLGDGTRRGLRLRPHRAVRDRELGVHHMSG